MPLYAYIFGRLYGFTDGYTLSFKIQTFSKLFMPPVNKFIYRFIKLKYSTDINIYYKVNVFVSFV